MSPDEELSVLKAVNTLLSCDVDVLEEALSLDMRGRLVALLASRKPKPASPPAVDPVAEVIARMRHSAERTHDHSRRQENLGWVIKLEAALAKRRADP